MKTTGFCAPALALFFALAPIAARADCDPGEKKIKFSHVVAAAGPSQRRSGRRFSPRG